MIRDNTIKNLIRISSGKDIPFEWTEEENCSFQYVVFLKDDKVFSVTPLKILIGRNCNEFCWEDLLDVLPRRMGKEVVKHSPLLFSILHEVGHYKTMVGLTEKELKDCRESVLNQVENMDKIRKEYRKIKVEARADKWAAEWIYRHKNLSELFSGLLRN